jgi:hypothetical protein
MMLALRGPDGAGRDNRLTLIRRAIASTVLASQPTRGDP